MSKLEPFFHALKSGNNKIAKDNLHKLLKKEPKSVHYKLLECYYRIKVDYEFEKSFNAALELVNNPLNYNQLTNHEVLSLLLDIFKDSSHSSEVSKIFETLLRRQPSNASLIEFWISYALENLNIGSLQKASFHLQKITSATNTNKRLRILDAAFNYYLASKNNCSVMEQRLFPQLGLKLITGIEPLQNDQEVFVKIKLLRAGNKYPEAIQILTELFQKKKFNEIDLTLTLLYLEILAEKEEYEILYSFTHKTIFGNQFDDYNFWNYLLLSAFKISKSDLVFDNIINCEFDEFKSSRNVCLTLINYAFLKEDNSLVKEFISKYYMLYGDKKCAYSDLLKFFKHPKFDKDWFMKDLLQEEYYTKFGFPERFSTKDKSNIKEVTLLLNLQKFKFLNNEISLINDGEYQSFIDENYKIFGFCYDNYLQYNKDSLKTDYFIGNELLILNLQVELSRNFSPETVLKQVIILRYVLSFSPEDFIIKLWLMKLYNFLNLPILTAELFTSLKIKNIQFDTLSHYISIRIATRFPEIDKYVQPILNKSLEFYLRDRYPLIHFLKDCYTNGSYTKIENYFEFMDKLDSSFEKFYCLQQFTEIDGLISSANYSAYKQLNFDSENMIKLLNTFEEKEIENKQVSDEFKILIFNTVGSLSNNHYYDNLQINYSDNRDFSTEWNAGIGHELKVLNDEINVGPTIGNTYLKMSNLLNMFTKTAVIFGKDGSRIFDSYQKLYKSCFGSITGSLNKNEFTEVESLIHGVYYHFLKVVEQLCKENAEVALFINNIQTNFQTIIEILKKIMSSETLLNWKFSHEFISIVHFYKVTNKLLKQYKQKYPRFFNKNNQIHNCMVDSLTLLHKALQEINAENQLKQSKLKNAKVLKNIEEKLIQDVQLNSLHINEAFTFNVFVEIRNQYDSVFHVLHKI